MDKQTSASHSIPIYISWAVMALAILAGGTLTSVRDVPLQRPLSEFPQVVGQWTMIGEMDVAPLKAALKADDAFVRRYRHENGQIAEVYVGYFDHIAAQKAPHAPQLCWVGSGWTFRSLGDVSFLLDSIRTPYAAARHMLARKGSDQVSLYYAYKVNDSYYTDLGMYRIAAAFDTIFKRKNNSYTLQITSPMPEAAPPQAEDNLQSFARNVFTILEEKFLPQ